MTDQELLRLADEAALKAYAPYSKFSVGAALLTKQGNIFVGCNCENVSFGLTNCAERTAVFNAISQEGPDMKIARIAITTLSNVPGSPCGACRQVMMEFNADTEVIMRGEKGEMVSLKLATLLPLTFVPSMLPPN